MLDIPSNEPSFLHYAGRRWNGNVRGSMWDNSRRHRIKDMDWVAGSVPLLCSAAAECRPQAPRHARRQIELTASRDLVDAKGSVSSRSKDRRAGALSRLQFYDGGPHLYDEAPRLTRVQTCVARYVLATVVGPHCTSTRSHSVDSVEWCLCLSRCRRRHQNRAPNAASRTAPSIRPTVLPARHAMRADIFGTTNVWMPPASS